MAGDWIRIRNDLDDDPHVLRLQELLAVDDVDLIIGKLRRLWKHADRHTEDGIIKFANHGTIDRIVGFVGFSEAMVAIGWLEFADGGCKVVRFHEHNGESAKKRAQAALRASRSRARKAHAQRDKGAPREEKSTEQKRAEQIPADFPLHPPSPAACVSEEDAITLSIRPVLKIVAAPARDFELTPEGLAQEWAFYYRGTQPRERNVAQLTPAFAEMIRSGVSAERIRARIRDPARSRTEYRWEFEKFFRKANGYASTNERAKYRVVGRVPVETPGPPAAGATDER